MRELNVLQLKNPPSFSIMKKRAIFRFIFQKSPNSHFVFLVPNLFPFPENTKAPQISPYSYLHYDRNAHANRENI